MLYVLAIAVIFLFGPLVTAGPADRGAWLTLFPGLVSIAFVVLIVGFVIGVLPSLLAGALTGALIGRLIQWLYPHLSKFRALVLGCLVCLLLAGISLGLLLVAVWTDAPLVPREVGYLFASLFRPPYENLILFGPALVIYVGLGGAMSRRLYDRMTG